ncbi:hypothetical protein [Legionella brunensis]|uniref:Lipoprotein n=1 Tax=Legionella brunensis TaxID=29422 RepID=A0A0W0S2X5_9GAMM|nr:hypothetical protein [Legionella brunensis]KTC77820.1 hypothetical protein Lbru_2713 [Legionella brunensis]
MNKLFYALGIALCLVLTGCKDVPPGDYDVNEVGKLKKVASGVIISKRPVKFHSKTATAGKNDRTPGSEYLDGGRGYVYVIKLNSGAIVSVAQAEDLNLKVKQKVLVVYGKTTRLLPDSGADM